MILSRFFVANRRVRNERLRKGGLISSFEITILEGGNKACTSIIIYIYKKGLFLESVFSVII